MIYMGHTNLTCFFVTDCILSKQFAIKQSHLIQVVTDLSKQIDELNRKVDLLLARSGESIKQVDDAFTVPDFLSSLPVKDDEFLLFEQPVED